MQDILCRVSGIVPDALHPLASKGRHKVVVEEMIKLPPIIDHAKCGTATCLIELAT